MTTDDEFMNLAIEQAKKSYSEGGQPIGAVLVSRDGKILGRGHNKKVQKNSLVLHGETDALENSGALPIDAYKGSTMYTTMSPCEMCAGACVRFGVTRVVLGENRSYHTGEEFLRLRGVEVVNLDNKECYDVIQKFISENPQNWKDN